MCVRGNRKMRLTRIFNKIEQNNSLTEAILIDQNVKNIVVSVKSEFAGKSLMGEIIPRIISKIKKLDSTTTPITGDDVLTLMTEFFNDDTKTEQDLVTEFNKVDLVKKVAIYDKAPDFSSIPDNITSAIQLLGSFDKSQLIKRLSQ